MSWSVRRRVVLGTVVTAVLGLGLAGIVLALAVGRMLTREFDQGLVVGGSAVATTVEWDGGTVLCEYQPVAGSDATVDWYQIRRTDGTTLLRSPTLGGMDLPAGGAALGEPPRCVGTVLQGVPLRVATWSFIPAGRDGDAPEPGAPPLLISVAREAQGLEQAIDRFTALLTSIGAGLTLVLVVVLAIVADRGLRPLRSLAGALTSLDDRTLDRGIVLPDPPTDLVPVVMRLNQALARLAASFDRERAFTADVAHELRTPLAALRVNLDGLSLATTTGSRTRVEDLRLACIRLQALVEDLLALARLDQGQALRGLEPVDLAEIALACWEDAEESAEARSLGADATGLRSATVALADRALLRQVVANLLGNAIEYADHGGTIRLSCGTGGPVADCVVTVANSGCRLPPEDAPRVCERFWRGDPARSGAGIHSGLGLAICRRMVEVIGGRLEIAIPGDGWFIARIHLPPVASARSP